MINNILRILGARARRLQGAWGLGRACRVLGFGSLRPTRMLSIWNCWGLTQAAWYFCGVELLERKKKNKKAV